MLDSGDHLIDDTLNTSGYTSVVAYCTLNISGYFSSRPMPREPLDLLQGTLDVLVLKTLTWGARHGYGIARWIRDTTGNELLIEDGALYTSLHRMENRGWLSAQWGLTDDNRRVKLYALTTAGRQELRSRTAQWTRYARAVASVLQAT
jgi:PadR family transcriptional regulator, regulatory protein PadR